MIGDRKIKEAAEIIKGGGIVIFPTETVYGIGADGLNENAVKKIFEAKGRKTDNPLILHICDKEMLKVVAKNINEIEQKLIDTFFPGPFTIILEKTEQVPNIVTGNLNTVGVRMPSNKIAQELIKEAGTPISAPSANISGRPSGTDIEDIREELQERVDYILDGGKTEIGLESTVVRVIDDVVHILRPGKITEEDIKRVIPKVEVDSHVLGKIDNGQEVLSPGMKYRHYAPKSKCVLVYDEDNEKMLQKMYEIAEKYDKPLFLLSTENLEKCQYKDKIELGHKNDLEEVSKNVFSALRKVDSYNPDIVIIEGFPKEGIGLAIMNRLIRACEYNCY